VRRRTPSPAGSLRHAVALLALACFGLGNLAAFAHELGERHVRCAEHGELIHVAPAGAVSQANVPRAIGPSGEIGRSRSAASAEHDHCFVSITSRVRAASFKTAAAILAPPPAGWAVRIASDLVVVDSQARFRLAPKASPPV
jgi:hypothetical protein